MQNVSSKIKNGKTLLYETNSTRGNLIEEHLNEHGFGVDKVSSKNELFEAVRSKCYESILITDTKLQKEDVTEIGSQAKVNSIVPTHIVLVTPKSQLSPVEAHQAGYSYVLQGNIDFNVLCDILNRVKDNNKARLFDGTQLRVVNQTGNVSYAKFQNKKQSDIELQVGSLGAGGFCYSSEEACGSPMPEEGTEIRFDIKLAMFPDYRIHGRGLVSWVRHQSDGSYAVGVEFIAIPGESEKLLRIYADLFKIHEFVPTKAA